MVPIRKFNRIPGRQLTLVTVTSALLGILIGSGIAWAGIDFNEMEVGYHVYHESHTECWNLTCEYDQATSATASGDLTEFEVHSSLYYNSKGEDDDVRYGILWVWDEQDEHSRSYDDFECHSLNSGSINNSIGWSYDGLDSGNDGVAAEQYLWYYGPDCDNPGQLTIHGIAWYWP